MSTDLTCPTCKGTGRYSLYGCLPCAWSGRRLPTLAEWDTLVAERDRYREALERISALAPKIAPGTFEEHGIARRALDSDPDLAERTRRIKADE